LSREKKLLVSSEDYGRDLTGVQNLRKKHKRLEAELAAHEPAIQGVLDTGKKLSDDNTIGKEEIQQRLAQFVEHWKELKHLAAARGQRLEESLEYQQFVANVEEEEAWINEKMTLVASEDYGDTLAAIQVREAGFGRAVRVVLPAGSLGVPGWSQASSPHARDGGPGTTGP